VPPLPTAHAICRLCGRILRVNLPEEDVPALQAFIDHRPDGWAIEGLSFSFTGLCPKCRIGPPL
jgi:Fe2+ or Zn2+ uptake regulation protein